MLLKQSPLKRSFKSENESCNDLLYDEKIV